MHLMVSGSRWLSHIHPRWAEDLEYAHLPRIMAIIWIITHIKILESHAKVQISIS